MIQRRILAGFDACVFRETWNYHQKPEAFLAWVEAAATQTRLVNTAAIVRWNVHKGYLRVLESRRVWRSCPRCGWAKVVIKPAVSGGSRQTRVMARGEAAQRFPDELSGQEDAMVQPYLPSVERGGELATVCLGGEVSDAVHKRPRFAGQEESIVPQPVVTAEVRDFADRVIEASGHAPAYARVDTIRGEGGDLLLSELELIEPSLFFAEKEGAAGRFVSVIERETRS